MRILQITLGFYPARAWGGPSAVVREISSEAQRRGYQVTVCTSNRLDKRTRIAPGSFERTVDQLRVVYLDTRMIGAWHGTVGPTWVTIGGMLRLWREIQAADLVHAHGTRNALVMGGAFLARVSRKPLVLQPHGTLPRIVSSVRLKRVFDRLFMGLLLSSAGALVALQALEEEQIVQAGGDAARIWVVPNGLATEGYRLEEYRGQFRGRWNIPGDRKIILFLGRINRKKGTDLLVEAFARLPERQRAASHLVIAGPDDGQLAEVEALVDRHGLEGQVLFTGMLDGNGTRGAYADADVFVLPCRTDTFPMTLVEACQAGVPILVTETCEIADVLADRAAMVVPVDVDSLAGGLCRLLTDAELQRRYRWGAQHLMHTEFSIEAVGDRLQEIYGTVLCG